MCLDDNHNSVVLACAKVIQSALSCDVNENYFDISEVTAFIISIIIFNLIRILFCILTQIIHSSIILYFQNIATCDKDICTAPVFRSRPDITTGFLQGGYWKYSAKPSNILLFNEDSVDNENEGKHTIQDDVVVAGQDFTAGLVRMGILPRLRYLLEVKNN